MADDVIQRAEAILREAREADADAQAVLRAAEDKLLCPFCGGMWSRLIDARRSDDRTHIKRRRECAGCRGRFNTEERAIIPEKKSRYHYR
jgi:hypothetical protein